MTIENVPGERVEGPTAGSPLLTPELPIASAPRLLEIITLELAKRFSDALVQQVLGSGTISGGCNDCASGCHGSCKGSCEGSCKGGCGQECKGDCAGTCKGDCSGGSKSTGLEHDDFLSDYLTRSTVQVTATFRHVLQQQGFPR